MADNESHDAPLDEALVPAPPDETPRQRERRFGRLGKALAVLALIVALAFAILWTQRERIANNVIGNELASRGIPRPTRSSGSARGARCSRTSSSATRAGPT
jgi:hypothetical protein